MAAAFEVVCHDTDPQWADERRRLVTGTVAAQLLGVHRYGSLLSTYLRMRGTDEVDSVDDDLRRHWEWAKDIEPSVIQNVQKRLGLPARHANALLRSTVEPWAGCTVDGWIDEDPFEIKTCRSPSIVDQWKATGIPAAENAQLQQQMLVTDRPRALIGVSCFGDAPIYQWVDRDEAVIGKLRQLGPAFLKAVNDGVPPAPDGSEDADKALAALHTTEQGKTVELAIDAVVIDEAIETLKAKKKEIETLLKTEQQKLRVCMGDAEFGLLPGGGRWHNQRTERGGYFKLTRTNQSDSGAIQQALATAGIGCNVSWSKPSSFTSLRRLKK